MERKEAGGMIVFDHASKVYPNGTVGLKDVTLTIQDGEFVAIIVHAAAVGQPDARHYGGQADR